MSLKIINKYKETINSFAIYNLQIVHSKHIAHLDTTLLNSLIAMQRIQWKAWKRETIIV